MVDILMGVLRRNGCAQPMLETPCLPLDTAGPARPPPVPLRLLHPCAASPGRRQAGGAALLIQDVKTHRWCSRAMRAPEGGWRYPPPIACRCAAIGFSSQMHHVLALVASPRLSLSPHNTSPFKPAAGGTGGHGGAWRQICSFPLALPFCAVSAFVSSVIVITVSERQQGQPTNRSWRKCVLTARLWTWIHAPGSSTSHTRSPSSSWVRRSRDGQAPCRRQSFDAGISTLNLSCFRNAGARVLQSPIPPAATTRRADCCRRCCVQQLQGRRVGHGAGLSRCA